MEGGWREEEGWRDAGEGVKLERSVVLLTEDRALRIKALLSHVPTKTPPAFLAWAGL